MRWVWRILTSLRLTVICLAASVVVVFIGTVAQADEGLYQAQERYFKQWLVWGVMLFGHRLPVVLPGGYLLGTVLVINLVSAHIKRFQWLRKKWGIHLAHLGIVVLLAGQLATDMLSVETHLRLREGETRDYTEKHRAHELVLIRDLGTENEEPIFFPEPLVARRGILAREHLPFELRVKNYEVNSEIFSRAAVLEAAGRIATAVAVVEARFATVEGLVAQAERAPESAGRLEVWRAALLAVGQTGAEDVAAAVRSLGVDRQNRLREELKDRFKKEMLDAFIQQGGAARVAAERVARGEPATAESLPLEADRGIGLQALVVALPETRELNAVNLPFAAVELLQDGQSFGTWLLSPWLDPEEISIGANTWLAAFRPKRVYHPFEVKLLGTTHEVYRGTEIPKNFQSRIQIHDSAKGETREVDISMNEPLRYAGLTFYQYQMGEDELRENIGVSTLLVVRNPGWLTPYFGCALVASGLTYHFLLHLVAFIGRRRDRSGGF